MAEINEKQKAWRRLPTDEEWQRIWKDYPDEGKGANVVRRNRQTRNYCDGQASPLIDPELDTEDPPASDCINLPMPTGEAETRKRHGRR